VFDGEDVATEPDALPLNSSHGVADVSEAPSLEIWEVGANTPASGKNGRASSIDKPATNVHQNSWSNMLGASLVLQDMSAVASIVSSSRVRFRTTGLFPLSLGLYIETRTV
jgi:hypothetical protein